MNIILQPDESWGNILLLSLKYSMGKKTDIAQQTSQTIKNFLPFLPYNCVSNMFNYMQCFKTQVNHGKASYGYRCDRQIWSSLETGMLFRKKRLIEPRFKIDSEDAQIMMVNALRYAWETQNKKSFVQTADYVQEKLSHIRTNILLTMLADGKEEEINTPETKFLVSVLKELGNRKIVPEPDMVKHMPICAMLKMNPDMPYALYLRRKITGTTIIINADKIELSYTGEGVNVTLPYLIQYVTQNEVTAKKIK
jgi:hypothetical protein